MEKMTLSPSSRQKSIMSLTFDEFQSKSGKNFGSMNMDEFLSNIWTSAEGDQLCLQSNNRTGSGSGHVPTTTTIDKTLPNNSNSFSIPSSLCNKTVDEVWFEIQREKTPHQNLENFHTHEPLKHEPTFSHMTLEDFLVQVGIVQEAPALSQPKTYSNDDNSCLAANIGMGRASVLEFVNNVPNNDFTQYEMATPSNIPLRESLNDFGSEDDASANRKKRKWGRSSNGPTEEAIKRRQRRMIKNRESAARSRARKQAYTVELELELNQIKQENEKLKQTVEKEAERKRNHEQALMRKVYTTKAAEKTSSIRRCMSMNW